VPNPRSEFEIDALSRYEALLRLSLPLAQHHTTAELLRALTVELHSLVPFDIVALILHEEESGALRFVAVDRVGLAVPPRRDWPDATIGPPANVWLTQHPSIISIDPADQPAPALAFTRSLGARITCWLPLTTAHRRLGVLVFGSAQVNDYSERTAHFMSQIATLVAVAVDNTINFERHHQAVRELRSERERMSVVLEINDALASATDIPSLIRAISELLHPVIQHQQISLALVDRESGDLFLQMTYDRTTGVSHSGVIRLVDRSPAEVTLHRGVPSVFARADLESLVLDDPESAQLGFLCCFPLKTGRGLVGTLNVGRTNDEIFSPHDIELLTHIAAQLSVVVENAFAHGLLPERRELHPELDVHVEEEPFIQGEFGEFVGQSVALKQVIRAIKTVAPTDATVLILGETGTGKELAARAIHAASARRSNAFVRLSGAALPSGLFESELFGYEKGAFTGATTRRIGRIELANRGTLFLDEVGDIPVDVQPKLLRVLQEREFERLGSADIRRADVRVIAATNRDLEAMVVAESFRSDLFYRLNVFPIHLPPLRERPEDIPRLAKYFTERFSRRLGRAAPAIPSHGMQAMIRWQWPGNIRELENVIERAVILSSGPELRVSLAGFQPKARPGVPRGLSTLEDIERESILRALRESGGVVAGPSGAAARLGVKRTTLQSMMKKLRIRRPSY